MISIYISCINNICESPCVCGAPLLGIRASGRGGNRKWAGQGVQTVREGSEGWPSRPQSERCQELAGDDSVSAPEKRLCCPSCQRRRSVDTYIYRYLCTLYIHQYFYKHMSTLYVYTCWYINCILLSCIYIDIYIVCAFAHWRNRAAFLVGSVRHLGRCFGCGGRTQRSVARGIDRVAWEQPGNQLEGHVHRKQHVQDRHEAGVGLAIGWRALWWVCSTVYGTYRCTCKPTRAGTFMHYGVLMPAVTSPVIPIISTCLRPYLFIDFSLCICRHIDIDIEHTYRFTCSVTVPHDSLYMPICFSPWAYIFIVRTIYLQVYI